MNYEIVHRTVYEYSSEVSVSQHVVHLTPRTLLGQQCLRHDLTVEPAPALVTSREDYFGNPASFFTMAGSRYDRQGGGDKPQPHFLSDTPWKRHALNSAGIFKLIPVAGGQGKIRALVQDRVMKRKAPRQAKVSINRILYRFCVTRHAPIFCLQNCRVSSATTDLPSSLVR